MNLTILAAFIAWALAGCAADKPDGHGGNISKETRSAAPAETPRFSGARAYEFLLAQTDFGPRNPNSLGHLHCLSYLESTLRLSADEVRLQRFAHSGYNGEVLRLTNIIASFRPERKERVLLCAHWDTRPRAEHDPDSTRRSDPILGANDGASGVAVLIELASLMGNSPPPVGVDIVLFDGEDYGREGDHPMYLLGSRFFAANKPPDYLPRYGLLLDMVGDAELEILQEETSVKYAPRIVDLVWNTADALGIPHFVPSRGFEVLDDHIPLNESGIPTVNIIDFNYPDASHRYWHTHMDTPEKCSSESLEAVGRVITHTVYSERE
ncbi:MAG: M28 family peptidase [Bacteroidota bacterium]